VRGAATLAANPSAIVHAQRFGAAGAWVAVGLCLLSTVVAGARWLRVAQREHYLPGSVLRFAGRWWLGSPADGAIGAVAIAATVAAWWWPVVAVVSAAAVTLAPLGLGVRGRSAPLRWTRRLRTLAVVWVVLTGAVVVVGWLIGVAPVVAAIAAVLTPLLVDTAAAVVAPVERRLADRYVQLAATRLARVRPTIVAITGSFGKTSTKNLVTQLVGSSRPLLASPASFNNRAGLARAVNENLADGTEVFVAEMGTYGVGEIAELCHWCPPDIAVITAIGPVHLERFGSEERILEAKSEILTTAGVAVLPVDDGRLAALADRTAAHGVRVVRCSTGDRSADVCVERTGIGVRPCVSVYVSGEPVAKDVAMPTGVQPSNLACAVAVGLELGLDARTIIQRLPAVHVADHRLSVARAPSGVLVVDDTYNANPTGTEVALDTLVAAVDGVTPGEAGAPAPGAGDASAPRLAVVTPGLVELGGRQFDENLRFGAAVAERATDLLVVGRTNRRALLAGAGSVDRPGLQVGCVRHRDGAVAWVREHLGPGDAVLYENDLPDHYP
jgi:UDP-N-acetylmuramoyl-tripeptide--D-alanyl-D-alanine ligase